MSSVGNKDGFNTIVMDSCFYDNIKDIAVTKKNKYGDWIHEKYSCTLKKTVYHCSITMTAFDEWIEEKI